jgi:hypothetical protein
MNIKTYYAIAIPLTVIIVGIFTFALMQAQVADGSAFPGQQAKLQIATTTILGPGTVTLFEASDFCLNRVITTQGSEIKVLFGDAIGLTATSVSATVGHLQAASTTVSYDSGLYGCGKMVGRASASTTVTTSSF